MSQNIFTGARCQFTINGIVFALGRSVDIQNNINYEAVEVLNNIEVLDHEAVGYTASLSAAQFLVVGKSLEQIELAPLKGNSPEQHLRNIIAQPEAVVDVYDSITDQLVGRVYGVRVSGQGFSVDARSMAASNVEFVCRRVKRIGDGV